MLKYRGRFRVLYECDVRTGKPTAFTFIPCNIKKGSNISRHSETMLNAYITSSRIIYRLIRNHPDLFNLWQDCDGEGIILFPESRLSEAFKILKAQVKGNNLSPRPRRKINISDERRKELSARMEQVRTMRKSSGKMSDK